MKNRPVATLAQIFTATSEVCLLMVALVLGMTLLVRASIQTQKASVQVGTLFALDADIQDPTTQLTHMTVSKNGAPCVLDLVPAPDQHTTLLITASSPQAVVFQLSSSVPVGTCGQDGSISVPGDDVFTLIHHMDAGTPQAPVPTKRALLPRTPGI